MHNFGRIRHYSSATESTVEDYGYNHSGEFLQGFREAQGSQCTRCQKKVYQTEKVEIGIVLHKNCFRCVECNATLTMNNFVLAKASPDRGMKSVFCKAHAPKPLMLTGMDPEAIDIRSAVQAQKITKRDSFNHQIRLQNTAGWEYDPKAMDFEHAKELHERNRFRRPPGYDLEPDELEYEQGELIRRLRHGEIERERVKDLAHNMLHSAAQSQTNRRKFPLNSDYMEPNALWSPRAVEDPWSPSFLGHTGGEEGGEGELEPQLSSSHEERIYESLQRPLGYNRRSQQNESCFSESSKLANSMANLYCSTDRMVEKFNDKDHRRAPDYENVCQTSSGTKLYMKDAAFIAQNKLELKQRHEHGEMFREFDKTREEQIRQLENEIKKEMEQAVQETLLHMDSGLFEGDLDVEKLKIEQHFQRLRDENMHHLLAKLNEQERMRIADMIDKQTQEMLQLIDKKVPAQLPTPAPPKTKKAQLYSNPRVFDDIDFHAVQVAQHEQESFTELVYELTKNAKTRLEKARAIFRWLTVKDLNQILFRQELSEENPYYALKGIKYGLESYHEVFKRLCSYAGLPVKIIRGVSKSAGYKPGMSFTGGSFRNSWTVVYIDNSWRFIDCHWGARHVTQPRDNDNPNNFCYAVDEFYFLTDPADMIFMHFPDEKEWQLLKKSITMNEFISRPVVKSHFFQYGLFFGGREEAVISTATGAVEIVLKQTLTSLPLAFNTRLEADGDILEGYSLHHTKGKDVLFDLVLPRRGVFFFSIFACDRDKSDAYNCVCSVRIKCTHVENKPFCKLPKLPDGYGPTPLAAELGLKAEKFSEYYIVCKEDKMILNLKSGCPVKLSHKLVGAGDDATSDALERCVFQRYRDKTFVSYVLRFPERGIYVFSLFAGHQNDESSILECACRYVIQCNARPSSGQLRPYPKVQQYWIRSRLHEPTSGDLKLNKNVKFKLEVQGADAVAVIVGKQWYYLKGGDSGKLWEGMAHTGKDPNVTVDVYAKYKVSKGDFFPLLEYKLAAD